MARPAKFTSEDLLDAAGEAAVAHWRDTTVAHVAERIGAPVGSIYHRFGSRDELFVTLWLRAVRRFQAGLLEEMALPQAHEAALAAALHIPRFCREHPTDAVAMTLYRQDELARVAPDALRDDVIHVNDEVTAATAGLARRRFGSADERNVWLIVTACQESPYGLVRRYLRTERIPDWLDDVVRVSTQAILALGD